MKNPFKTQVTRTTSRTGAKTTKYAGVKRSAPNSKAAKARAARAKRGQG